MVKIEPNRSRVIITDTSPGVRIILPNSRSWFVICFLGLWICGWAVAEYMVSLQLLNGDAPPEGEVFMLAWFVVWTIGGLLALYALLWQLMGKEIVMVYGGTLKVRHDIGGYGFNKEYDLAQLQDLRTIQVVFNPLDLSSCLQLWGVGGGTIAFDYGTRVIRFGAGLAEVEATQVAAAITQRYLT